MTPRRGLVWPLLLILLGVLALAANLGLIPGNRLALEVLALWPLVLVLVGLDIALAHRHPIAAVASELAVVALAVVFVVLQPIYPQLFVFLPAASSGGSAVMVPRGSATALTFHLSGGAGSFTVRGGATDLVDAYSDSPDLALDATGTSTVSVRVQQGGGSPFASTPAHVDARLASDIPTSLTLDAGAGDFIVDLRDTKVTDARLSVGAASLRLVLPKPSGDVPISVTAGASSVVIEVPDGVEASVITTGALVSIRSENPRVTGTQTPGYGSATDRVTVRVTAGASSVVIR